jgi:predicted DNA-binding transcriptional regulator AlpA
MPVVTAKSGPKPGKISKLDGLPQLLTRHDVAALLDVHFETVKRLERAGKFPRPVRITPKIVRYDKAAIEKFLQDAAAGK